MGKQSLPRPASIVTLDPYNQGGVRTLMTAAYGLFDRWGFSPQLVYTLCDPPLEGKSNLMGLRGASVNRLDMDAFAMPSFPVPLWLWFFLPVFFGWDAINDDDLILSTGGSSHIGLLPAMKGRPFVLWIATAYEDELRSKVAFGDSWAKQILDSPAWRILKWQERFVLRRASRILATSEYTAQRLIDIAPEITERISVVTYPVDTERYHPDSTARDSSPYGRYLMLSARLSDPRKNIDLLLRAFSTVRKEYPDLKLVLVGEEPGEKLTFIISELNLADNIVFTGRVSDDDLIELYQGAELFTLSSKQEGLGIVVLESLACGTPVLSTRCGGPERNIIEGETGYLVPNDDLTSFTSAILSHLKKTEDERRLMRQRCADYAQKHFSWAVVEGQFMSAFEAVFPKQMGIMDIRKENPSDSIVISKLQLQMALAAFWAIFIFVIYTLKLLDKHWLAIRDQIIAPIMGGGMG